MKTRLVQAVFAAAALAASVCAAAPAALPEVAPRDGIGHFLEKAKAGPSVTVAYLGGSITAMTGWRNLTTEWLGVEFPKTKVNEVAASIGGTGSDLGVFRLEHDALRHNPDLLFVEFATNDRWRSEESIIRQIEGIVRQTWAKDPTTDIVFVYTVTVQSVQDYREAGVQRSVKPMEKVAAHYGIPSVDFGPRVLAELDAGRLVMSMQELETAVPKETPDRDKAIAAKLAAEGKILFAADGVHPAMPGHGFYCKSVQSLFAQAKGLGPADHAKKMAESPVDPRNLQSAKMVAITPDMLTGEWALSQEMAKSAYFLSFMDEIWETKSPGAKLSFTFDGSQCRIYDLLGPDGGQVWITVDGKRSAKPVARFDSYCTYHRMANLSVFDGAPGRHTVEIELDAQEPDRQSVAFRLKNPQVELAEPKYHGTRFWPAKILVDGDVCRASAAPVQR